MTAKNLGYLIMSAFFAVALQTGISANFSSKAAEFRTQLSEKVLPYWYDTAVDRVNGGYYLSDDLKGRKPNNEKQLVTQSRMVWGFSHAHINGFSTPQRNYLEAAEEGYKFLNSYFFDKENGGYFWKTDIAGNVLNDRKILYGEAFVIYAFVEYYRASHNSEALKKAMNLFHIIQKYGRDNKNGGWFEHFTKDWKPIMKPESGADVEVPGYKSANAHLHWMEALTELYSESKDKEVKNALQEAIDINKKYFYPKNPGFSCFHRTPDWKSVDDPKSKGLSYGHNVEFAWLMIRAETALGRRPSWSHFEAHLKHALKYGYDFERGGLYYLGDDDQPATNRDKIWWVQSEMLAALTDALSHDSKNKQYEEALIKLIDFLEKYQINPPDGIWLDTVTEDGKPKNTAKAHNWKANYHDLRALVKFINKFGDKK
ncbi:MAG: AGE family epimerase/isomerase [Limisphaerales bacterium]